MLSDIREIAETVGAEVLGFVTALYDSVLRQFVQLDDHGNVPAGFEHTGELIRGQVTKTLTVAVKRRLT